MNVQEWQTKFKQPKIQIRTLKFLNKRTQTSNNEKHELTLWMFKNRSRDKDEMKQ